MLLLLNRKIAEIKPHLQFNEERLKNAALNCSTYKEIKNSKRPAYCDTDLDVASR